MPLCRRLLAVAWMLILPVCALCPLPSFAARGGSDTAPASTTPPTVPRGLVVVLRPPELTETMKVVLARITGELTAASFQVRVESLDLRKDPAQQIQAMALEADAVAAFALGSSRDSLAIWIFERLGHRTTIQRVPVRPGGFAQDAKVSALKAVELIRASLADLWPAPATAPAATSSVSPPPVPLAPALPLAPPGAPAAPTPLPPAITAAPLEASGAPSTVPPPLQPEAPPTVVEPPAPPAAAPSVPATAPSWPPAHGLAVSLGVASLWDLRSTPQWMGSLQLERRFNARFAAQVRVGGLGTSLAISARDGGASIARARGSLGAAWAFWGGTPVYVSLVAALGVERLTGSGHTDDRTRSAETATDWLPIGLAGLTATLRVAAHWAVAARVEAEWAWSGLHVVIGETRTEALLRPGALAELALQATF